MTELLAAEDAAALDRALASIDVDVPLRSEGRKTRQAERYACVYLLATLPRSTWTFPLRVDHDDRPDFVVVDAGDQIGIEHTEVVPENHARQSVLRESGQGPDVYFIRPAVPGEPRKSTARLRREIADDASGSAWVGDSPERQWAGAVAYCIARKTVAARRPGFRLFERNWLLLYEQWPLPAVDAERAASLLRETPELQQVFEAFDRIYVLDDQTLWEFTPNVDAVIRKVKRAG